MEQVEITKLLDALSQGNKEAGEELFLRTYTQLKRIARNHINRVGGVLTINPSTLVHEAYLKYARHEGRSLSGAKHFYNMLGQAMRQILMDIAKKNATTKHGAASIRTDLKEDIADEQLPLNTLMDIDEALVKLESYDAELAKVVEWHFFAGLSFEEIAEALEISERTVRRQWNTARLFMMDALEARDSK